ncbi:MAG: RNA polymerase sigma factor [Bryobacterales bacterium]|nr:RNA polymerase sigma factor [Bryobacterales bacterium]
MASPEQDAVPPRTGAAGAREALDAELLRLMPRYQDADRAAADALVLTAGPVLARYFYSLTGDTRLVEDLVQECWLRIHRARQSYRRGEPVLPWLMAIARHTRVDQYRRWKRSSGRETGIDGLVRQPSSDPRPGIENSLQAREVVAVLHRLPDSQREVLTMMKTNDMSVEEVALATGVSQAAVKQKAFRAYQAIRKALGVSRREENER